MATIKIGKFVDAAVRAGVVEDTPTARTTFASLCQRDPNAAQQAFFQSSPVMRRVDSRIGTRAGAPKSVSGAPTGYPASWHRDPRPPSGVRATEAAATRLEAASATPSTPYPARWLGRAADRVRVAAARGGEPVKQAVHAAGDTARYVASVQVAEQRRLDREQPRDRHEDGRYRGSATTAQIAAARTAELERMQREQASRLR